MYWNLCLVSACAVATVPKPEAWLELVSGVGAKTPVAAAAVRTPAAIFLLRWANKEVSFGSYEHLIPIP